MNHKPSVTRFGWLAAVLVATALLGGCVIGPTRSSSTTTRTPQNPLIEQASALAGNPANAGQIDALLAQLDDATLAEQAAMLPEGHPLYPYAGRALLRRGLPLPRPFDRVAWQFDASARPPAAADGYRPPVRLAVLLPLSGDLSAAAAPVRDGLLAGYYGESRQRPDVQFYDTHGTPGGAIAAYDRAAAEGNDFVVGPLGRDEVGALFSRGNLTVPVLALNRASDLPPAGNASFSLSPEDEGVAAAGLLLERGARNVLVIAGPDDSQRRAVDALRNHLAEHGATVTGIASAGVADFSPYAQAEGGIDAVFLAVRGNVARELMPRLALAGLAGLPRVATSHLLSGTGKPEEDRVLDGIAFPGETWTSGGYVAGLPPEATVAERLPTARGGAARLFAFGYDAWLLTAYLDKLAQSADASITGATGVLRIDGSGNVQRTPAWSTFSAGVAVPLANAGRY
ncbi:penicillin-binding protein activator [Novilysobacter arseniciresistens]|uniref:penicillin-binding protein activator n=1 Tax=Novilysobacter arseniciresistens TaxID=1385522 RepID=UPI0006904826|nr:penicillin-binding protein activator [Lysobacter arseniciresistens]